MNPLVVILCAAMGVVGAAGLSVLPPDEEMAPATAYLDPWADLEAPSTTEARQEPRRAELVVSRGICPPVYDTAAQIGFTPDEAALLDRIAWHESRCSTDVLGDLDRGVSYGILQIHGPSWCEPNRYWPIGYLQAKGVLDTCEDLFDPAISVIAAGHIYREGGFQQWSTYEMALEP